MDTKQHKLVYKYLSTSYHPFVFHIALNRSSYMGLLQYQNESLPHSPSHKPLHLHNYNTKYLPNSFNATLKVFEARYDLKVTFLKDSTYSGDFIYKTLIYTLRELLRRGEI